MRKSLKRTDISNDGNKHKIESVILYILFTSITIQVTLFYSIPFSSSGCSDNLALLSPLPSPSSESLLRFKSFAGEYVSAKKFGGIKSTASSPFTSSSID